MGIRSILWVDLRLSPTGPAATCGLEAHYRITEVADPATLPEAIPRARPEVLCFEYDHPDLPGLAALRETKRRFQQLPILMLTETHSEDLAVWAFRSGARDYLVKPVAVPDLQRRLDSLVIVADRRRSADTRAMMACPCPVPAEFRIRHRPDQRTRLAVAHIAAHYHEPIYLETLARICGMSGSHFSRAFKAEQGEAFSRYLIRYRVSKALELLQRPGVSVTDAAFAVGFSNPSHLTHSFRRYTGMYPSEYSSRTGLGQTHSEVWPPA